jgi:hypothetical protein
MKLKKGRNSFLLVEGGNSDGQERFKGAKLNHFY